MQNSFTYQKTYTAINGTKLVLGLGPGRCGTDTLAAILAHQESSFFMHEAGSILFSQFTWSERGEDHWVTCAKREFEYLDWLRSGPHQRLMHIPFWISRHYAPRGYSRSFVGDVAFYHLPYVEKIIQIMPDTKFICLQRNLEDNLRSWLERTHNQTPFARGGTKMRKYQFWKIVGKSWDKSFPLAPPHISHHKDAMRWYISSYYQRAELLQDNYPANFIMYPTEDLDNLALQGDVLSWAGFPNPRPVRVHKNKRNPIINTLSKL